MSQLTGKTILVVDDEADLREILSEEFQDMGATVLSAENGRVAAELARSHKVDIIISDIRMPGGDGVELLKSVREMYPQSPPHVFLVTGFSDLSQSQAIAMGAQGMISKPFNLVQLRKLVAQCFLLASA